MKKRHSTKRHTYEYVKSFFLKEGWKLLSTIYINGRTKLNCLCANGHKRSIDFHAFKTGNRCLICAKHKKYTIDEIKNIFKKEGYILLSKRYKNNKSKLKCICRNGHYYEVSLNDFLHPYRCKKCMHNHKYTIEEILQECKKRNWKLLTKKYKTANKHLKLICDKGHLITTLTAYRFLKEEKGCSICYYLNHRGKKHHNYNKKLSDKERFLKRNINKILELKELSLLNFKHTCRACNKKFKRINLHIHHLEGWHWCKELRYEISNIVLLCDICHKSFHKQFGTHYNTSEQFYNFLRNFK